MDHATTARRPLAAERPPWLRGTLRVPGDEAISHLALISGAMARGETIIDGLLEAESTFATVRAMQALGARIERRAGRWHVMGLGVGGFLEPESDLDFRSTDLGLALALGLLGSYRFTTRLIRGSSPSTPPLPLLLDALRAVGVRIDEEENDRLAVCGPRTPVPIDTRLPAGAEWTHKAALLLAGLAFPGISAVREAAPSRDHAEAILGAFGARVGRSVNEAGDQVVEIEGLPNLRAQHVLVPADISAAAFGIVAALVVPGSELRIEKLPVNPTRMALVDTLLEMGAVMEFAEIRRLGGEQVADLRIRHSELSGITVDAGRVQSMPAEYPALAVAAAFAAGDTTIELPAEMTAREGEQLRAVAKGLRVNGVSCQLEPEALLIRGGRVRGGGRVETLMDHRIAMSFLIMGMAADDAVIIDDQSAIPIGFPDFITRFEEVGASFIRYTE